ncbi:hypothetical protein FOCG_17995 [Fusarium oxysporum f. sp. radicis-lycopersici 26381]|nr:hypothetical protein FOCG_17995 [Fusarium oxysporum f. sp. radicis-lycopersici 26381]
MSVSPCSKGQMPLYMYVVHRVLRDLRLQQQHSETAFEYQAFKTVMQAESLTESQSVPLRQRLETMESFMTRCDTSKQHMTNPNKKNEK